MHVSSSSSILAVHSHFLSRHKKRERFPKAFKRQISRLLLAREEQVGVPPVQQHRSEPAPLLFRVLIFRCLSLLLLLFEKGSHDFRHGRLNIRKSNHHENRHTNTHSFNFACFVFLLFCFLQKHWRELTFLRFCSPVARPLDMPAL